VPLEAEHGLDDAWVQVHEIDSSFHDVFALHQSRRIRQGLVTPTPWHADATHGRSSSTAQTLDEAHNRVTRTSLLDSVLL
jgi:hypothetical protein